MSVTDSAVVGAIYAGPRTIVLIPSISTGPLRQKLFRAINSYEERYLYFLFHLANPKTRLIAVLSEGWDPFVVTYFIDKVSQVTRIDRRLLMSRFEIVEIADSNGSEAAESLSARLLGDDHALAWLAREIGGDSAAHARFFRVEDDELQIAERLGIPYYGLPPQAHLVNTKSGARNVFAEARVPHPHGVCDIADLEAAWAWLSDRVRAGDQRTYLVKINDEGSGAGIVKVPLAGAAPWPDPASFVHAIADQLPVSGEEFAEVFAGQGGVIEEFVEGEVKESPSVQFELLPDGRVVHLSTHVQVLDGTDYVGARYPATHGYRDALIRAGHDIARVIAGRGGRGIVSIDFVAVYDAESGRWALHAIEVNARKGGTNHPFRWVQMLTGARFDEQGLLYDRFGPLYYASSEQGGRHGALDSVEPAEFAALLRDQGLDYDSRTNEGVFVHMWSTMRTCAKLGVTIVAHSPAGVADYQARFDELVAELAWRKTLVGYRRSVAA